MSKKSLPPRSLSRRRLLRAGGAGMTALAGLSGPGIFGQIGQASAAESALGNRILVVLEHDRALWK